MLRGHSRMIKNVNHSCQPIDSPILSPGFGPCLSASAPEKRAALPFSPSAPEKRLRAIVSWACITVTPPSSPCSHQCCTETLISRHLAWRFSENSSKTCLSLGCYSTCFLLPVPISKEEPRGTFCLGSRTINSQTMSPSCPASLAATRALHW